jgi:hypothetical protein
MDNSDILNVFAGGDLSPELWPSAFKYPNFEYDTSVKDRLNARRLILSDLQISIGFALIGHQPPIELFIGVQKCLNALTAIVLAEYKEKNDA